MTTDERILDYLQKNDGAFLFQIAAASGLSTYETKRKLVNLEMQGKVRYEHSSTGGMWYIAN